MGFSKRAEDTELVCLSQSVSMIDASLILIDLIGGLHAIFCTLTKSTVSYVIACRLVIYASLILKATSACKSSKNHSFNALIIS